MLKNGYAILVLSVGLLVSPAFADKHTQAEDEAFKDYVIDDEIDKSDDDVLDADEVLNRKEDECIQEDASESWLDITQSMTFMSMCKTVSWFDHLFGETEQFEDDKFGGKLTIGFNQTEYDGFDPKVRLRIKTALPNVSSRMSAFIGRVDEDDFVGDTGDTGPHPDSIMSTSVRRQAEDESEWLIGLGYRNPKNTKKGFDYSIGAKISSGLNPYAKVRYRYNFKMPESHYLRAAQTVFWKNDDGYGTTTNIDYYYIIGFNDIFQVGTSREYTQDSKEWEWVTAPTWYHQLDDDRGISLRAYVRGREKDPVTIPDYGIGLSYRQPFLRDWLFIETLVEHEWIKDYEDEPREGSWGVGLQFEMEFGDYSSRTRR